VSFAGALIVAMLLLIMGASGTLGPLEGALSAPLDALMDALGGTTRGAGRLVDEVADYRRLEQRNRDLEEALAIYQSELAQLKEKARDYDQLAALLDYDRFGPEDHEYVTCDVIGTDTSGFVRAIRINCGRRQGLEILDPVVTELGLVGRISKLSATGASVLLLSDANSRVNARLQATRADGLVVGQLGGDLLMTNIPLDAEIREGDRVMTNGLGQMLPADLLIGQVMSKSLAENELYQQARVRSLVDFDRLEFVQVLINFEPVDISVFEEDNQTGP